MSKRDIEFYLIDIFIAIDKIKRYTSKFSSANELLSNELYWDGVIRELEIIGEATKHLLNNELIDIYYRRVVDFRNQISHGYFGIDADIVWEVATKKLLNYEDDLKNMINKFNLDLKPAIQKAKKENSSQKEVVLFLEKLNF